MEGSVYLVGDHSIKEGIVLMCSNGEWNMVCGDRWSEAEADVVCSTFGYSTKASKLLETPIYYIDYRLQKIGGCFNH